MAAAVHVAISGKARCHAVNSRHPAAQRRRQASQAQVGARHSLTRRCRGTVLLRVPAGGETVRQERHGT